MQIFGRRPRQKRGNRCFVLLLPLLIIFLVFAVLTAVRFRGFDTEAKITNLCIAGVLGLACILVALLLYRRTRRFYGLGRADGYPYAAIREQVSRDGWSAGLSFFAADEAAVRTYLVADGAGEVFSDKLPLTQAQKDRIIDAYFDLIGELRKVYSYQEFIPFYLNFLQNKKIFCERELFFRIFGSTADPARIGGSNCILLYDPHTEWPPVKENWLSGAPKGP